MENPGSPQEFRRTCPACKRPVEPGFKFCEFCGTHIPELSTCSKCGTQFIAPVKSCDLCGAPVILVEMPGPDELPEKTREENTRPVEDGTPERYEEEIPEPAVLELPEYHDEENAGPAEDGTPERYEEEILEPDTDELLEKYGKGYSDDATLDSHNEPKPPSPINHEKKNPVTIPSSSGAGLPATIDDALFLSPGKPEPVKPPVNRLMIIGGGIGLIIIIAAVYFIGLPMFAGNGDSGVHSNVTVAVITPVPEQTIVNINQPAPTVTRTPASSALAPLPTQVIPGNQEYFFSVRKNPVNAKITVIFTGSAGIDSINSADVKVSHPDGAVTTGIIMPLKGVSEVTLSGSTDTDRVEIIANMFNGRTYRVYDDLVPYRE
jgi:hypothetical protein